MNRKIVFLPLPLLIACTDWSISGEQNDPCKYEHQDTDDAAHVDHGDTDRGQSADTDIYTVEDTDIYTVEDTDIYTVEDTDIPIAVDSDVPVAVDTDIPIAVDTDIPVVMDTAIADISTSCASYRGPKIVYGAFYIYNSIELSELHCVEEIHGDLNIMSEIHSAQYLWNPDLTQLSELKIVSGTLAITATTDINYSLDGLQNLETVGGTLWIRDVSIRSMQGLNGLTSVGALNLNRIPTLETLSGLDSLRQVAANTYSPESYLILSEVEHLVDLQGLHNLSYVEAYIQIVDADRMCLSDINIFFVRLGKTVVYPNTVTRVNDRC